MELFLKFESVYQEDIKKALEDEENPFDAPNLNLKNVDRTMTSMKKYMQKMIKAAATNFQKEINLMSSSILSKSVGEEFKTNMNKKNREQTEGLPPGITK